MTRRIANPIMAGLTRAGMSIKGSRVLHVQGRRSGDWHTVPVNPLTVDGRQYLVAPRGETQWVRNMRVAGGGRLQLGRTTTAFTATEVLDADVKAPLLQAYLRTWRSEVGMFFDGVDADSLDALRAVASGYPIFVIDAPN
jgi:deazaflavin-dependent oxidoreductase (nitroreductase family)